MRAIVPLMFVTLMLGACASTLDRAPVGTAEPVSELRENFRNINRDGVFYFAGVPTKEGIDRLAEEGVTLIVNLRTQEVMARDAEPFDEEAYARSKGIDYLWLPTTPRTLNEETIEQFAKALREHRGKALIHCNSANTAGGLWAAYLAKKRNIPLDIAIEKGRAAGLSKDSMVEAVRRVVEGQDDASGS